TMRMKFEHLAPSLLPGSRRRQESERIADDTEIDIQTLVANLRGAAGSGFAAPPGLGLPIERLLQAGDPPPSLASSPPPLPPVPPEKRAPQPEERFRRSFRDDDTLRRLYE
ncbi:MAG: hypothetical protein H3C60_13895, partial [Sphingomonadaceae bacterium]|nr:hypothetical protein [Sphingomonadaceae bacterium]